MRTSDTRSLSYAQIIGMFKAQGYSDKECWLQAIARHFEELSEGQSPASKQSIFERLIKACNFDWVNSSITPKNFPIESEPDENTEFELVCLKKPASTADVLVQIEKCSFVPATFADILLYVRFNPDKQKEFPIVALGSQWQGSGGYWSSPYASDWRGGRGLYLYWREYAWYDYCCFLVCKR